MMFHPGQTIWYVSGTKIKHGTIVTGELIRNAIECRVEVDCQPDPKHPYRNLKMIRLKCIIDGERIRCKREMARCAAEIATDEGALLGLRDWEQELKQLEDR